MLALTNIKKPDSPADMNVMFETSEQASVIKNRWLDRYLPNKQGNHAPNFSQAGNFPLITYAKSYETNGPVVNLLGLKICTNMNVLT